MVEERIAGFDRITGDFVSTLEDTSYVVVKAENREVQHPRDRDKTVIKPILTIEIGGQQMEWFANRTSIEFIARKQGGFNLSDLTGYKGTLVTVNQRSVRKCVR